MIAEGESAELADELIAVTCAKEHIAPDQLILHSDRGSSMQSKTVAQLLADLGVTKSLSRPYTANDNPYSEAQFKTMKYRPGYPDRFGPVEDARAWARDFFHWYNHEHHHTGLGLLTPAMAHHGLADTVLAYRQQVLQVAYRAHPERFVRGLPTPPELPQEVWINRPQSDDADGSHPTADLLPDLTEPGAQAGSRVPEEQAQRSLDAAEHLATVGKAVEQPSCTHPLDTNFPSELSQSA